MTDSRAPGSGKAQQTQSEPQHDRDCMALVTGDAPCRCVRGRWLDEVVPRHVARAEVFAKFERWSREQEIYDVGDLAAVKGTLIPAHAREVAAVGIRAAELMTRAIWQRIAVGALNMRRECERRVGPVQPEPVVKSVPAAVLDEDDPGLFPVPPGVQGRAISTVAVAGDRL